MSADIKFHHNKRSCLLPFGVLLSFFRAPVSGPPRLLLVQDQEGEGLVADRGAKLANRPGASLYRPVYSCKNVHIVSAVTSAAFSNSIAEVERRRQRLVVVSINVNNE